MVAGSFHLTRLKRYFSWHDDHLGIALISPLGATEWPRRRHHPSFPSYCHVFRKICMRLWWTMQRKPSMQPCRELNTSLHQLTGALANDAPNPSWSKISGRTRRLVSCNILFCLDHADCVSLFLPPAILMHQTVGFFKPG